MAAHPKRVMNDLRQVVYQPKGVLRRYVREILLVQSERPRVQVLLPETTLTMVFRQSGQALLQSEALPDAVVSGLQERTRLVEHAAGSSLVIVRFTEVGAPAVLHDRVDPLYNQTAPLDTVLPRREVDGVQNTLADTREIRERLLAVERFLLSRVQLQNGISPPDISPQIEAAVTMIRSSEGRASIATIARRAAMSLSALERQFRAAVGATPKKLSSLARLQHVCRLWDAGKNLTQIAYEAGYCDQPHMVRDFRRFTGAAPEEFLRRATPRNLPTFYK